MSAVLTTCDVSETGGLWLKTKSVFGWHFQY